MDVRKMACFGAAGLLGTMLAGAVAYPANGQPGQKPVTVTAHREAPITQRVPYGDLALATKGGRSVLMRRVSFAVDTVCPQDDDDFGPYDVQGCKDFAWDGARPQIRRAINLAKSGATLAMTIEITSASK